VKKCSYIVLIKAAQAVVWWAAFCVSEFAALDTTFLAFAELDCYKKPVLDSQRSRDLCTHRGQLIEEQIEGRR